MNLHARVVLPLPLPPLSYAVPEHLGGLEIGRRVWVPLGPRRWFTGWIHSFSSEPEFSGELREILEPADDRIWITAANWEFYDWLARYYLCTVGEVVAAALPGSLQLKSETYLVAGEEPPWDDLDPGEENFFRTLFDTSSVQLLELQERFGLKGWGSKLELWMQEGWLQLEEHSVSGPRARQKLAVTLADGMGDEELHALMDRSGAPRQRELLEDLLYRLEEHPNVYWEDLRTAGHSKTTLDALVKKNVLNLRAVETHTLERETTVHREPKPLSHLQAEALKEILAGFDEQKPVLLHGVTSSGKTELYIHLLQDGLSEGKQLLYLLPEIALTSQIVDRLRSHFGEQVRVYHSRISERERQEVLLELMHGTPMVLLGARSSLLLPFRHPGLVIVDEEHDASFKQMDPAPRYHARDAALYWAHAAGVPILLGSATPSFESYRNAREGKYHLVELHTRHGNWPLPEIEVEDLLRESKFKRLKGVFSERLLDLIGKTVKAGQQVILFQNRRGYAPTQMCTDCGEPVMCRNCDITLTYHKMSGEMKCHYCGYTTPPVSSCSHCGGFNMKTTGLGTERVEEDLELFLPGLRMARLDLDSTRRKNSFERILRDFGNGEIQVLIGTQMVTKGLDFDRVGLVGVLHADSLLNYPDFRSHERAFQMLSQVAGRAGRKEAGSLVLIQAYRTDHRVLHWVRLHDYQGFSEEELQERKLFRYPPFTRLIRITLQHGNKQRVYRFSHVLGTALRDGLGKRVLGPEDPPVARIRNKYHRQLLIKAEKDLPLGRLKAYLLEVTEALQANPEWKSVRVIYDADP